MTMTGYINYVKKQPTDKISYLCNRIPDKRDKLITSSFRQKQQTNKSTSRPMKIHLTFIRDEIAAPFQNKTLSTRTHTGKIWARPRWNNSVERLIAGSRIIALIAGIKVTICTSINIWTINGTWTSKIAHECVNLLQEVIYIYISKASSYRLI